MRPPTAHGAGRIWFSRLRPPSFATPGYAFGPDRVRSTSNKNSSTTAMNRMVEECMWAVLSLADPSSADGHIGLAAPAPLARCSLGGPLALASASSCFVRRKIAPSVLRHPRWSAYVCRSCFRRGAAILSVVMCMAAASPAQLHRTPRRTALAGHSFRCSRGYARLLGRTKFGAGRRRRTGRRSGRAGAALAHHLHRATPFVAP